MQKSLEEVKSIILQVLPFAKEIADAKIGNNFGKHDSVNMYISDSHILFWAFDKDGNCVDGTLWTNHPAAKPGEFELTIREPEKDARAIS